MYLCNVDDLYELIFALTTFKNFFRVQQWVRRRSKTKNHVIVIWNEIWKT